MLCLLSGALCSELASRIPRRSVAQMAGTSALSTSASTSAGLVVVVCSVESVTVRLDLNVGSQRGLVHESRATTPVPPLPKFFLTSLLVDPSEWAHFCRGGTERCATGLAATRTTSWFLGRRPGGRTDQTMRRRFTRQCRVRAAGSPDDAPQVLRAVGFALSLSLWSTDQGDLWRGQPLRLSSRLALSS